MNKGRVYRATLSISWRIRKRFRTGVETSFIVGSGPETLPYFGFVLQIYYGSGFESGPATSISDLDLTKSFGSLRIRRHSTDNK